MFSSLEISLSDCNHFLGHPFVKQKTTRLSGELSVEQYDATTWRIMARLNDSLPSVFGSFWTLGNEFVPTSGTFHVDNLLYTDIYNLDSPFNITLTLLWTGGSAILNYSNSYYR